MHAIISLLVKRHRYSGALRTVGQQSFSCLQEAINRLALAGEQVGISVEDMIQMLNAGVSVETLLDLIYGLHSAHG